MTVLCLIETEPGGIADASVRALTVAGELAQSAGADLAAVWFGPPGKVAAASLAACGLRRGYAIDSAELTGYAPLAAGRALTGLAAQPPDGAPPAVAIVAAATDHGNEMLAHAAAIAGLPMAANCVAAASTGPGEVRLTRQRWAGSLLEDAVLDAPLALLTVAADAVTAAPARPEAPGDVAPARPEAPAAAAASARPEAPGDVVIAAYQPRLAPGDLAVTAARSADRRAGVSLATARVVIGGGRGVGGEEGFAVLEELAGLLGAAVGVSRVVTSQGWRPHTQQVGQTGTKITPDLYLACGISGAIQHMAGCQGAKTIIAINTDPGAPMMTKADYAVTGDLHQIIPALTAALRARQR